METSVLALLGAGFLLGLRHALDPDHLAAVSALVSQERRLPLSCLIGTVWGAGHTLTLLAAAVTMMTFKLTISTEASTRLELVVALVLVLLGGHVLLKSLGSSLRGRPDDHPHDHGALLRAVRRPFLVGAVHGLAGTGALMLLVPTVIPSSVVGLVYVLVFGIGATAGMLVLSGMIGIPFFLTAGRSAGVRAGVQALAGAASLLVGLTMAWGLAGLSP